MSGSDTDEDAFFDAVDPVETVEDVAKSADIHSTSTPQTGLHRGRDHCTEDHIGCHIPFSSDCGACISDDESPSHAGVRTKGEDDDDLLINSRPLFPMSSRIKIVDKKLGQRSSEVLPRSKEVEEMRNQHLGDPAKKRVSADAVQLSGRNLAQTRSPKLGYTSAPGTFVNRTRSSTSVSVDTIPEEGTNVGDRVGSVRAVSPHICGGTLKTINTDVNIITPTKADASGGGGMMQRLKKVLFSPTPSDTRSDRESSAGSSNDSPQPDKGHGDSRAGGVPSLFSATAAGHVHGTQGDDKSSLFDGMRTVQTNRRHRGPIWAVEFSPCGRYFASGGRDAQVIVWSVGIDRRGLLDDSIDIFTSRNSHSRTPADSERRQLARSQLHVLPALACDDNDSGDEYSGHPHKMNMIYPEPCRVYTAHTDDVVDLAWTRKCFLLSASTDKTVRLWNVKMPECLRRIDHPDLLTAVQFHPVSERYFVTGCYDGLVRVWDLLQDESREVAWNDAHDIVTAVCFSPDGVYVIVGLFDGRVYIYETTDMKYYTVLAYKKKKIGGPIKSRKITGVTCISRGSAPSEPGLRRAAMTKDKYYILVTSNDSRIRLFTMTDFTLVAKFHGASNFSMQIRAHASVDGKSIICGSDTGDVFLWQTPSHGTGIDECTGGDDGYIKALYDTKHRNVFKYEVFPSSTNAAGKRHTPGDGTPVRAKPCACTRALFVPLQAVHNARLAADPTAAVVDMKEYAHWAIAQDKSMWCGYSRDDESSVAILSAFTDGSFKLYFAGS